MVVQEEVAMSHLIPRALSPALKVETVNEDPWDLSKQIPRLFTMVVFYRGWHCLICKTYLKELER